MRPQGQMLDGPLSRPASGARRLGLHHLAFFRACLDGLDPADMGERYLGERDPRVLKRELAAIRAMLANAARRAGKPAYARLFAIPPERLAAAPSPPGMDLEAFRERVDPEGYMGEADLIALFMEQAGDPASLRRAARNERLRRKLRDALAWLEQVAAQPASPEDPVEAWFDAGMAKRLMDAGFATLGDIAAAYRRKGSAWAKSVRGVGATKARRIAQAIERWGVNVGLTEKREGERHVHALVPLERLLPAHLSGETGANRDSSSTLAARDDKQAIESWLFSLSGSPHTSRSYRKEAERFLLWMIFERGKPMSSASVEDCAAYRDFLADIGTGRKPWPWRLPEENWVGPQQAPRWSAAWRPFSGRLTLASQRQAVVILTVMHEWLARQRYLRANPWAAVPPTLTRAPAIRKERVLTREQFAQVLAAADSIEDAHARARARAALILAYHTGARLAEIASLRVGQPAGMPGREPGGLRPAADGEGYEIEIVGKGKRVRVVPASSALMAALAEYMDLRGMGADPAAWPAGASIIASLPEDRQRAKTPGAPITTKALYEMFKRLFRAAAMRADGQQDLVHLWHASPHWLRHSHATHALDAGAAIQDVQDILGHASPATTAIYSHASLKRKRAVVEAL